MPAQFIVKGRNDRGRWFTVDRCDTFREAAAARWLAPARQAIVTMRGAIVVDAAGNVQPTTHYSADHWRPLDQH